MARGPFDAGARRGHSYGTARTDGDSRRDSLQAHPHDLRTFSELCSQSNCTVAAPNQILQLASDGTYGTTLYGGANGRCGTVFKVTPSGTLTTLYGFYQRTNCADSEPYADLHSARTRHHFAGQHHGAAAGLGGSYTFLHSFFNADDGTETHGALVQTLNVYETTRLAALGANGRHRACQVTARRTSTATLYTFCAPSGTRRFDPFAGLDCDAEEPLRHDVVRRKRTVMVRSSACQRRDRRRCSSFP